MALATLIEWAEATFNPWIGCSKVSPGCRFCYAAADTPARISRKAGLELWGSNAARRIKAESGWKAPLAWDRMAAKQGRRLRVFCGSQCDVFEDRADLVAPRLRLFDLIERTPNLVWMLLTKRPGNVIPALQEAALSVPGDCDAHDDTLGMLSEWLIGDKPPANVWLGTSVEDQEFADRRIPTLLSIPARVRFLSCEPLLGRVSLTSAGIIPACGDHPDLQGYMVGPDDGKSGLWKTRTEALAKSGIDWVIVGGESGPNARPMHPEWARSLRDQCVAAGVAFHFKQWGEWLPDSQKSEGWTSLIQGKRIARLDAAGRDLAGIFGLHDESDIITRRVGKKAAGRILDGRTWDELPATAGVEA